MIWIELDRHYFVGVCHINYCILGFWNRQHLSGQVDLRGYNIFSAPWLGAMYTCVLAAQLEMPWG